MSDKQKTAVYIRMANEEKPKAAIYCRVASADEVTIKTQEEILHNYAVRQMFSVCGVYSDNGVSGVTLERPAFVKMMSDIERGEITCVIVKDLSRLSRDFIQLGGWLNDMRGKGVRVISVNDGYDSDTPRAVFDERFTKAIERTYKAEISEKIKTGIARKREADAERRKKAHN
jgi:DNA invertase Pin-like site-specific DNA recombinase